MNSGLGKYYKTRNRPVHAIAALAYNVLIALKLLHLPDDCQGWQLKTLLRQVLLLPAALVRHARVLVARAHDAALAPACGGPADRVRTLAQPSVPKLHCRGEAAVASSPAKNTTESIQRTTPNAFTHSRRTIANHSQDEPRPNHSKFTPHIPCQFAG
jgi:hypothetical protein